MLFLDVAKVFSEQHQVLTEVVAGGTMALVSTAAVSRKGRESGGKVMYKVVQGQQEGLCKDGRGQELDAQILGAKGIGYTDGVQQDIQWP